MKQFEFLPHTAEVKFRAYGTTLSEAFENTVLAISSFIAKENTIKPKAGKVVSISGTDKENLLYNLVEEILNLLDVENFVVARANITVLGNNIKAEFYGDDAADYQGLDYIKAPTYAETYVKETADHHWEIQMVLDV